MSPATHTAEGKRVKGLAYCPTGPAGDAKKGRGVNIPSKIASFPGNKEGSRGIICPQSGGLGQKQSKDWRKKGGEEIPRLANSASDFTKGGKV